MATKTFKVSLSLDNPRIIQSGINVHSFDKQSIKITIELTKNSQVYQIPTDAQIKISLLKLARQEQKIILDVPFTSSDSIDWIVPDYLDGYQGEVRVGIYLIVGTENIDVGYFNITSSVSDIDNAAEEFTESVLQGWAIEDLTALLPQFQAVLDETTGKDVISAPEIILARGGAQTLGERLDGEKAEVSAQLAQKADQSDLDTTNQNIILLESEKASKSEVQAVANGSPKGVYASVSALQTAFPSGTTGVYLVTADGKWHYWNGTAWTAGGVYQSTSTAPIFKPIRILRNGGKLPILDNIAKTLTFPSDDYDMIVYVGDAAYTGVIPPYSTLTFDLSTVITSSTTAWAMLFRLSDKTFVFVPWNTVASYKDTHALFATIRVKAGKYHFNFPFPYIEDGKLYGYISNEKAVTQNTLDAFVKGIAHRGYSTEAPENTLPAYKLAKQKGFSYVECDISWSSDGIPVLLHDDTIDRTSNGTGSVNSLTLAELKTYDFGSWKSSVYAGTTIPTFEEFIILCKKLSLHPYIETKGGLTSTQAQTLVNITKKLGMSKNVSWISFNLTHLSEILSILPTARVGYVVETFNQSHIDAAISIKTSVNDVFIDSYHASVTTELAQSALISDIPIEVWTLNVDSVVRTIVEKGVSGISTDNLNIADVLAD